MALNDFTSLRLLVQGTLGARIETMPSADQGNRRWRTAFWVGNKLQWSAFGNTAIASMEAAENFAQTVLQDGTHRPAVKPMANVNEVMRRITGLRLVVWQNDPNTGWMAGIFADDARPPVVYTSDTHQTPAEALETLETVCDHALVNFGALSVNAETIKRQAAAEKQAKESPAQKAAAAMAAAGPVVVHPIVPVAEFCHERDWSLWYEPAPTDTCFATMEIRSRSGRHFIRVHQNDLRECASEIANDLREDRPERDDE